MRKLVITILFSCFLLLYINLFSENNQFNIKYIKSIGDNRNDYTFFKITAGLITPEKDIYIGDGGGHFIAKYSWHGKYIKRIGQPGQGPCDFNTILFLNYSNKKIYVYDMRILRVTVMSTNLKPVKYIQTKRLIRGNMFITNDESILGTSTMFFDKNENGRIVLLNSDGNSIKCFFDQTQFGKHRSQKD